MFLAAGLYFWVAPAIFGQQSPPARRHFEVASVKPSSSGKRALEAFAYSPGGGFTATNATLVDMIVRVYPTRRIQMQGGPEWIDSARFDVVAKADAAEREVAGDGADPARGPLPTEAGSRRDCFD